MDAVGAGGQRAAAQIDVIVLPNREDRLAGGVGLRHGSDAVVGTRGQVDDDPIDVGEGCLEAGCGPDGYRDGVRRPDEIGQAGRPDQVIGQDGDARAQPSVSAR